MREIKFRALDKSMNKFHYPQLWDNSMPYNWDKWYVLQQFTGLQDKNGKDIYEGDILKYILPDIKSEEEPETYTEYIEEVVFEGGMFTLEIMPLCNVCDWCAEVIGNIYENPELLTHKNNNM